MESTTPNTETSAQQQQQQQQHPPKPRIVPSSLNANHRHRPSMASTVREQLSPTQANFGQVESAKPQRIAPYRRKTYGAYNYYSGPLDPTRHTLLPFWMRLHGSITPKLVIPLSVVAGWATMITCISQFVYPLIVDSLLLTILGFVVGLALSFRVSTANERYAEGRRYWAQIVLSGRMLGHHLWIHATPRSGNEKKDLLDKLAAINLVHSFAVAVKDKLRHKVTYNDVEFGKVNIASLHTFTNRAQASHNTHDKDETASKAAAAGGGMGKKKSFGQNLKQWGKILGIPFLTENPRREVKDALIKGVQLGNLPYEILNYLGWYLQSSFHTDPKILEDGPIQGAIYGCLNSLMEAYGGCERVSETPLPVAYNIVIAQITWLYVLVLPFQLFKALQWIAIPGTVVAAYIILGLAAIGRELEDPFGEDVNDLDLEHYCSCLEKDLHVLTSQRPQQPDDFLRHGNSRPLFPVSFSSYDEWSARSIDDIYDRLALRPNHRYKGFEGDEFEEQQQQQKEV